MESIIETTIKPQIETAPDAMPVVPQPSLTNGHVPKSLNDPIIPNHPLAPLAGKYADEPLWDKFQEAIRTYRRRINEQEDEDATTPAFLLPGQQNPSPTSSSIPNRLPTPLNNTVIDETLWEEYQEAIREYRRRIDEQEQDAE